MTGTERVDGSKAIVDNLGRDSDLVEMVVIRSGNAIGPVHLAYGDVETVPDFSELKLHVRGKRTDFRIQNASRRRVDFIVLHEQAQDRIVVSILAPGGYQVLDGGSGFHCRVIPARRAMA